MNVIDFRKAKRKLLKKPRVKPKNKDFKTIIKNASKENFDHALILMWNNEDSRISYYQTKSLKRDVIGVLEYYKNDLINED